MKRATKIRLAIATAALLLASIGGWVVRWRIERYAANKLLFDLIKINDVEGVTWAAGTEADVNAKGDMGYAPLHVAAMFGSSETVQVLIEAGAEIDGHDIDLDTPLHRAAMRGRAETVRLLINAGAEVNASNKFGLTPLHHACIKSHAETAILLIKAGAKVNAKDNDGDTPLHWAATRRRHNNTPLILIDAGAKVNAKDSYGRTVLDKVFFRTNDSLEETKVLLRKHGAKTSEELKAEKQ